MSSYTLFIFEGEKIEKNIFENMIKYYLTDVENTIIICAFCAHIYALNKKINDDPDQDIFILLRDMPKNAHLKGIPQKQVSEIYMFFDYDGHVPGASDNELQNLLKTFNDETENGKIYISYPMVEALKHPSVVIDFKDTVATSEKKYKSSVNSLCTKHKKEYVDFNKYTAEQWKYLVDEHAKKLNYIMEGDYKLPEKYFSQEIIFLKQKEKYITPDNKVSVLSPFPIFLVDFYGISKLNSLIN